MDSDVVKSIHARSGQECIFQCVLQDESCRSVNFGKTSTCEENCEFLSAVASENPEQLHKNEQFDYYILLQPTRSSYRCNANMDVRDPGDRGRLGGGMEIDKLG